MIHFLALLLPLFAFSQAKNDKLACNPPDPEWTLTEVAEWAKEMDILGNKALRDGEVFTKFGNPVDESCYKGLTPDQWKKRLARMEAGISHAVTQAQRCWSALGLAGATGIISRIRRTNFNCKLTGGKLVATASHNGLHAPTFDHTYELKNWGEYMDTAPMDWVGSSLFHEVLHWSVDNNRSWHNHPEKRKKKGCDKSLFEDRVYLMEAACFPRSDVGELFYDEKDGAANCKDVCKKALVESDKNTLNLAQRLFQGATQGLHGHKYKPKEAELICERISKVPERYKASREERKFLQKRSWGQLEWAAKNFGEGPQSQELQSLAREAFLTAENAYDPSVSLDGVRKIFSERKEKFVAAVEKTCTAPESMHLSSFCKFYSARKNPVSEELERFEQKLKEIKASDFNLYTPAPKAAKLVLPTKK